MISKEQQIKEVIDDLRPDIQMDGGDIEFDSFNEKTGVVKIKMKGACVGCPMSNITLKQGIEYLMKQSLDFVTSVEDATVKDEK